MLYHIVRGLLWIILRTLFAILGGIRIVNWKNVPRSGAVIVSPNHLSHADGPLMGFALMRRKPYYIATDELFGVPFAGALARFMRTFPIKQDSPDRNAIRHAEKLLKAGEALVIFPEGHLSKTGTLQPLQGGPILIAMRTGTPILPVAITGTNKLLPPPHQFKLRHAGQPVVVRFGKPIPAEELTGGMKGKEGVEHGVQVLTEAIKALIAESEAEDGRTKLSAPAENTRPNEGIADRSSVK